MKKEKSRFICDNCGHVEVKWAGRCPACLAWNSFTENIVPASGTKKTRSKDKNPVGLSEIGNSPGSMMREDSGMDEINRVLGGGITRGSVVLIGGEPGIGKSTIMMQLASVLSAKKKVLYISGEESRGQIKLRAERLGISANSNLAFFFATDLDSVTGAISKFNPSSIIIDSVQTLFSPEAGTVPGTVSQLKYCCQELIDLVKSGETSLFLIAHVTKEGIIAGPKTIEHMVDTVLYFEHSENDMRILRAVKNRFGSVDELGLFRMSGTGLNQITSPENAFISSREGENPPGICIAAVHEGSRVFLVEIQSLTVPAKGGISRVFSDRIDSSRISRIAAVLEKHTGLKFSDQDIYVNVAGGMRIKEVGVDLAAALALYSARTGIPIPAKTAAAGEISLTGEIRPVPFTGKRVKSALSFGISEFHSSAFGDAQTDSDIKTDNNRKIVKKSDNINQIIKSVFSKKHPPSPAKPF
ncbi:MAG: DNA repair protein RadA [Spirochaetia bacterium]|jgi:DNA repair protein RadA/Sms|nr:DNA repair protein RadA [Spirochaetia bacterium]